MVSKLGVSSMVPWSVLSIAQIDSPSSNCYSCNTGSMVAVLGMPLTTLVTRGDIDTVRSNFSVTFAVFIFWNAQCLAWIFLAGSSAGTFTNVLFLYVLARFPGFIRHVKSEGAEPDVVVRLATFYQLNVSYFLKMPRSIADDLFPPAYPRRVPFSFHFAALDHCHRWPPWPTPNNQWSVSVYAIFILQKLTFPTLSFALGSFLLQPLLI